MRIVVAYTFTPFGPSGGRQAAEQLAAQLPEAELSGIPLDPDGPAADQRLMLRLLDLQADAERVICLGTDAALLRHADKRVWLDASFDPVPTLAPAQYARALAEARRVAVTPGTSASRLLRVLAMAATPIEPTDAVAVLAR